MCFSIKLFLHIALLTATVSILPLEEHYTCIIGLDYINLIDCGIVK